MVSRSAIPTAHRFKATHVAAILTSQVSGSIKYESARATAVEHELNSAVVNRRRPIQHWVDRGGEIGPMLLQLRKQDAAIATDAAKPCSCAHALYPVIVAVGKRCIRVLLQDRAEHMARATAIRQKNAHDRNSIWFSAS